MRTDPLYIAQLIRRKFNGELTEAEIDALQVWSEHDSRNVQLIQQLEEEMKSGADMRIFNSFDEEVGWSILRKKRRKQSLWYWGRIAAALLVLIGTVSFFLLRTNEDVESSRIVESKDERYKNDILPAIKGAKIVLEDGTEVKVNDNVTLLADGSISTDEKTIVADAPSTTINKLVVPAAHFLHMTLSDGTKVWINASSELVFPSQFTKDRRQVKLKGEAYFQVAKDQDRPFVIETVGGNVKVLGTHFNISAYTDRPVTTLEEGKVMVYKDHLQEILYPGMKGEIVGSRIDLRKADLQKELAWKNNLFYFKGDNIVSIAKELQNWYDLEVSFSKGVSLSQTYTGEISRSANLTEVLKMLEFVSDLDFKIDNNKLVILKKKRI
ncbi:FecR family protein [Sphingobacterium faecale]|uniref:FecR family protein n=1 Tax=Sphingobacterium faecale TaxID=2803775 RepID=A0ABS1R7R3_9SPHI|nr:FecR family protein [Sphingobacterium faecale]MBL1410713.1 FecR family protein [Sphingobacterium faecale]